MSEQEREPEVMPADFLIGERVVNSWGEDLGRIEEIILDAEEGRVRYAVLSFGSVFGLGEKLFAVPWQILRFDAANRQVVIDIDRERLKEAPGFDRHDWPPMTDPQWGREIHRFYDQTPYWETLGPDRSSGGSSAVDRKPRHE